MYTVQFTIHKVKHSIIALGAVLFVHTDKCCIKQCPVDTVDTVSTGHCPLSSPCILSALPDERVVSEDLGVLWPHQPAVYEGHQVLMVALVLGWG